jgi:hypothetical protein
MRQRATVLVLAALVMPVVLPGCTGLQDAAADPTDAKTRRVEIASVPVQQKN